MVRKNQDSLVLSFHILMTPSEVSAQDKGPR